jgi:hypothetical protein
MKKIILALVVLSMGTSLMAQTELDALKYIQPDINGTARYIGMAGAFGALGGDASAIKDNPAGLGIYRKSEIVGTLNAMLQNSTSNWQFKNAGEMKNSYGYGDSYKNGMTNFSVVLAAPTLKSENGNGGLLSSNWSFSFDRLKTFNRSISIKSGASNSSITDFMGYFSNGLPITDLAGDNDPNGNAYNMTTVPWLSVLAFKGYLMNPLSGNNWESFLETQKSTATPSFDMVESGNINEYSLSWAGNFSNLFYLGTSLNYKTINYSLTSHYTENYTGTNHMQLNNTILSTGGAINLNIGAIVRPTDFLRFGLSLHLPTVYQLNDKYESSLDYNVKYTDDKNITTVKSGTESTPTDGYNDYQIQGPLQINLSAAFIIGKKGLVSTEYNFSNYTGTRLLDKDGNAQSYNNENQRMNEMFNNVQTIKIGGEYKLTDNFSLRAGYANMSNATKDDAQKIMYESTIRTDTEYFLHNGTNYITAGFGYREASWFLDFGYMHKIVDETFMPYRNVMTGDFAVNPASVLTYTNNAFVTLGFKF